MDTRTCTGAALAPGRGMLAPRVPSLRPRPLLRLASHVAAASNSEDGSKAVALSSQQDDKESLYFEPFVRSFVLGVGSGVLLETVHVALQFMGLVERVGLDEVATVLPSVESQFAPLFVADHFAAITGWVGFYVIEAVAIAAAIKACGGDREATSRALSNLVTLPQRMLPLKLQLLKQFFLRNGSPTAAVAAAAAASEAAVAAASSSAAPAPPATASAFLDGPAPTNAGAALLERAQYPSTLPLSKQRAPKPSSPQPSGPETPREEQKEEQATEPRTSSSNVLPVPEPLTRRRSREGLKPGQWDAGSSALGQRQAELAGRTSYLLNFWYAAALSENVVAGGKPVGVDILGKKVVLFRGEDGRVRCLDDVCPHRGAPLSKGWVGNVDGHECVVCPYHGWAFDEGGHVRDVPAAVGPDEWPKRSIVEVYPVEEKGGFVWLFNGSANLPAESRPPIPYVPELEDPAWKPVYGEIMFDCNHHGVFENAIDMAHIHYLHGDSFGNEGKPQIRDMEVVHDAFGITANFKLHNKPVNAMWEWSKVPEVEVTAQACLPSTSVISFTLGNGLSFTTFVNTVPISANRTVNRFALVRNLAWDSTGVFNAGAWDAMARRAMLRILGEDKQMVERLRPDLLNKEFSVRADLPQIAFRKLRQEYVNVGYAVAPEAPVDNNNIRPDL